MGVRECRATLPRLIVQADRSVADRMKAELREASNVPIHHVSTLAGALALNLPTAPVVILGLDLPDSTGKATFHSFTAQRPDQPVLVVSRHPRDPVGYELIRAGAMEYLELSALGRGLLPIAVDVTITRWHRRRRFTELSADSGVIPARFTAAGPMLAETVKRITRLAEALSRAEQPQVARLSTVVADVAAGFESSSPQSADSLAAWLELLIEMGTTPDGPSIEGVCNVQPLPPSFSRHVKAAIQEMLVNAIRHANAGSILVDVTQIGQEIRVRVTDDGCGLEGTVPGDGRRNLERRASELGGRVRDFRVSGVTTIEWWATIVDTDENHVPLSLLPVDER